MTNICSRLLMGLGPLGLAITAIENWSTFGPSLGPIKAAKSVQHHGTDFFFSFGDVKPKRMPHSPWLHPSRPPFWCMQLPPTNNCQWPHSRGRGEVTFVLAQNVSWAPIQFIFSSIYPPIWPLDTLPPSPCPMTPPPWLDGAFHGL